MKLKITVDGRSYDVEVEVEEPEQPIYGVGGYIPMSPARIPAPPPIPVTDGALTDLAVEHEFRPPLKYEVRWFRFDNMTGRRTPVSPDISPRLPEEARQAPDGTYFSAVITTPDSPSRPVMVTLRKAGADYRVVGCSRQARNDK